MGKTAEEFRSNMSDLQEILGIPQTTSYIADRNTLWERRENILNEIEEEMCDHYERYVETADGEEVSYADLLHHLQQLPDTSGQQVTPPQQPPDRQVPQRPQPSQQRAQAPQQKGPQRSRSTKKKQQTQNKSKSANSTANSQSSQCIGNDSAKSSASVPNVQHTAPMPRNPNGVNGRLIYRLSIIF